LFRVKRRFHVLGKSPRQHWCRSRDQVHIQWNRYGAFSLAIDGQHTGMAAGELKETASWHNLAVNGSILLITSYTADV
jgi:hypothetical protein